MQNLPNRCSDELFQRSVIDDSDVVMMERLKVPTEEHFLPDKQLGFLQQVLALRLVAEKTTLKNKKDLN